MPNQLPTKVQDQLAYLKYSEAFILDDFKGHVTKTPTLIIGVGGTGIKALVKTKHLYKTRYNNSDHLYFYGIDTDEAAMAINERTRLQETNLRAEEFFHLHSNLLADMRHPHRWTPEIHGFMPDQVTFNPARQGAGGYRLAGRFLLFRHIDALATQLRQIIEKIRSGANVPGNNTQIHIMILTGIAGGTGSGCSLDIAYLLRAILSMDFHLDANQYSMNGYIILPDVNALDANNAYLGRNGYAYLKELDYLNSLGENGERFEQTYTNLYRYNGNDAPFVPYLFSSEDAAGHFHPQGFDRVLGIVSESIMEFISDSIEGNGQNTQSVISNIDHNLNAGVNRNDIECMNYRTFGAASYRLPLQEMTQYLFGLTFETLEPLFGENQSNPKDDDFKQLFNDLYLSRLESTNNIHEWYRKGHLFEHDNWKNLIKSGKEYSYDNVITADRAKIYQKLRKDIYMPVQDVMNQVGKDIHAKNLSSADSFNNPNEARSFRQQLEIILNQAFVDPARGPIFVAKLFGFGDGNPYSNHTLRSQAEYMVQLAQAAEQETDQAIKFARDRLALLRQEEARPVNINLLDKRRTEEAIVGDYIQTSIDLVNAEAEKLYYQTFQSIYQGYGKIIDTVFRDIYRPLAEIMLVMRENLKESVQHLTGNYALQETSTIKFFLDLQNVLKSIKIEVDSKTDTQKQQLMKGFLDQYHAQQSKFIGRPDEIDIIGFVKEFLQAWYGKGILSTRLAAAIKREAGIRDGIIQADTSLTKIPDINDIDLNTYLRDRIIANIKNDSQPLIHLSSNLPGGGAVIHQLLHNLNYEQLALPADSSADPINQEIEQMGIINQIDRIGDNSHISMLNFVYGFSLYMYSQIKRYEDEYQAALSDDSGHPEALHLFSTREKDWRQLPSVIPLDNWAGDNRKVADKRAFYQHEEKQALFDRAVAHGIIKEEGNDYILPVNDGMRIAQGTAVQRFMKMYENYKLIEALVQQETDQRQAEEAAKREREQQERASIWRFKVLLSGLIRPREGSLVYELLLGGEVFELGNILRHNHWKEYYLIQRAEEILTPQQLQLFKTEVDEAFERVAAELAFLETVEEFKKRVLEAKNSIIVREPAGQAEMLAFYEGLEREIANII
ncbi:tubulin-like doman-containing protein [Streptococcus sp. SS-4456]|uniref:tubulin-like doman-containing protein n=1 Tax=Streptococcus sp. SS-4456 TaxID=3072286 RepID=UPI002FC7EB33